MTKPSVATSFSALLLVATTLERVVCAEEALFSQPGPGFFKRTLLASRSAVIDKACNVTSKNWIGGDKFQQPLIISSPGECCRECQATPDCVIWVWRGCCDHCWIKNSIPARSEDCHETDCISGEIRQQNLLPATGPNDEEDRVKDKPLTEIPTELNCERSGKVAAIGASYLACKAVLKRCKKPKKQDVRKYKDLEGDRKVFQGEPDVEGEKINRKQCARISRNACAVQATASKSPAVIHPECMALLMEGPASPSKGCENREEAQEVFKESAEAACRKS